MEKTLSFLYLEDSDLDVQIFSTTLLKEGLKHKLVHARTRKEFVQAINDSSFDIIFSDYALPSFDGLSALEMVKNICPDTPFIIISGNIGEELAIETLKRGATDYVLKSHFTRLIPSITRALNEKRAREKAKTDEGIKSRYDFIVNSSRSFLSLVDRNYTYEAINNAFCSAHNLVREEIIGKKLSEIWGEETFSSTIKRNFDSSFANREVHYQAWFETPRDGLRCYEVSFYPYRNEQGEITHTVVDTSDITEKKKAEKTIRESEEKYRTLVERARDGIIILTRGSIVFVNNFLLEITGYERSEVLGQMFTRFIHPAFQGKAIEQYNRRSQQTNGPAIYETVLKGKGGREIFMEVNAITIKYSGEKAEMFILRDISERRLAEEKIRRQTEDLTLINELNKAVNEGKSLNRIFHILSLNTRTIFSSLVSSVHLISDDKTCLLPVHTALPTRSKTRITQIAGRDLSGVRILLNSKSIYTGIIRERVPRQFKTRAGVMRIMSEWIDPVSPETALPKIYEYSGIRAILSIPLFIGEEVIGILEISKDTSFTDDDINRIFSVSRQISSIITRKLNEEKLLDSESRYRVLFETANDSIFLLENNRFVDCNKRTLEIFGARREQLIGATPVDFSPVTQPDGRKSREKAQEMIDSAMKNGPGHFEWLHQRKDGTTFFAEVSLNRIQIKGKSYLQAIVRDISGKKKAEEEQMRLITAIEQSDETVLITDRKGTIQYVNPAFEQTSGYSRKEALGRNPAILKSGRHDKVFYDEMWAMLKKGKVWKGKFVNRKKDGSLYEELATISPITDEKKQIVNFVAVKRDITKESQLETQLRQVQKMETIGTLAGGIAHDFNNILATIMGYADMILKDLESGSPLTDDLMNIMNASVRGKELVKKILTFSRQVDHRNEPVHFDLVLRESIELIRTTMPSNIFIRDRISDKCAPLMGDPTQLQQVFMNLCTNAFYAMQGRGGFLDIALECFDSDDVRLEKLPQLLAKQYLLLSVRDEGAGMKPDVFQRIFEPFFTTKPVGEGTGLGLSVTHGIIRNMGGEILVDTEWGKGTTFSVYFPVEGTPDVPVDNHEEPFEKGREHILVVDDQPVIAGMIHKVLKEAGYRVTAMTKPHKAVEMFRKETGRFDLVIFDQEMSGLRGEAMAEILLAISPGKPLIMTAAYSEMFSGEKIRKLGLSEYLCKPLTSSELYRAVRNALVSTKSERT